MQRVAFIARPRRRCGQVINDSPCWCRGPCAGQIAIRTAPLMLPGRQELNCVATHRVKTSVMTQSCQGQCTSPLPNIHFYISCSCCYWCRSCSSYSCHHFSWCRRSSLLHFFSLFIDFVIEQPIFMSTVNKDEGMSFSSTLTGINICSLKGFQRLPGNFSNTLFIQGCCFTRQPCCHNFISSSSIRR